ncbi:ketopantoate reductase family protein [Blautia sp.]|jgi:2-dehydropantoate 2-reductase|uniref:ketopantoate reductase family protein n=1 Tax=Blautia sp. TaxID=1955243 RepID=UPI003AB8238B
MKTEDKKIAVIGIGGVGGYVAGMLAKAYPHVTMVARGARGESIRENGLVLHSDYKGEIVAKPERVASVREMGQQDYIFICVKNYSLEDVCENIRDMVTDDTVIIPVMNGVDPGEKIRSLIGRGMVVDSLIYTVAFANADFSISQQDTFTWLCIGIKNADQGQQEKVTQVAEILKGADIDYKDDGDIEVEIWRKYILNCAFNVMTAFYDNTIGELRRDPVKAQQYETLVWEAASVGRAKGVALTDEHIQEVIHKFRHVHADNATSSLQRDFQICKKQTELETFSGYIVQEAKRLGVSIPLSEEMYQGLKAKAEKF